MLVRQAGAHDALDVLAWRNDPHTRAMSREQGVLDRDQHVAWFSRAIRSPDRRIYIGESEGRSIGMVRFDRIEDGWEVSINIAPDSRSRGHGLAMLTNAISAFPHRPVIAEILEGNDASVRLFQRCGFEFDPGTRNGFHHCRIP